MRLILYVSSSLTVMAAAALAPALPAMEEHFAGTRALSFQISLLLTLPALATAIAAPLCGFLTDRSGRDRALVLALWLYAIAGGAGAAFDHLPAILVTRAMLGVAVALIMTSAMGLVADYFSGDVRRRTLGRQAAWTAVGGVLFPIAGGVLAEASWRAAFLPLLVAAPLAWMAHHTLPRVRRSRKTRPTVEAARTNWSAVAIPYSVAVLGMMIFNVIPLKVGFLVAGPEFSFSARMGVGVTTGLLIGCLSLFAATGSALYAMAFRWLGYRGSAAVQFALMGVSYIGAGQAQTVGTVAAWLALGGLGLGLLIPNATAWVLQRSPVARRGLMLGGLTTAIFGGQFLAQFLAEAFDATLGIRGVFVATGGFSVAIAVLVPLLVRRQTS